MNFRPGVAAAGAAAVLGIYVRLTDIEWRTAVSVALAAESGVLGMLLVVLLPSGAAGRNVSSALRDRG
jgi:hypothetical protein